MNCSSRFYILIGGYQKFLLKMLFKSFLMLDVCLFGPSLLVDQSRVNKINLKHLIFLIFCVYNVAKLFFFS
jgi:hypothetical protein